MPVTCPKCGCDQITAQKAGFNAGAAILGDMMIGPLGLAAGSSGRNNIIITCLSCGHSWRPGKKTKTATDFLVGLIFMAIFVAMFIYWVESFQP